MSMDALIERMEALLGPLQEAGDARRFFHATYLRTTRAVRDALRAGLFGDPEWVERWDVAFADLYLDALAADTAGGAVSSRGRSRSGPLGSSRPRPPCGTSCSA